MDETSGLYKFVLAMVLVGFLVGISALLLDKTSVEVKTTSSALNENISFTSQSGTTSNNEVVALLNCYDATNKSTMEVNVNCTLNNKDTGILKLDASYGSPITVQTNYTYKKDTTSSLNFDASTSAVGSVASSWMSLIITIMVLSVVLGLVIVGFSGYGRQ